MSPVKDMPSSAGMPMLAESRERLADRGLMTPFWSMWIPNFIFLAVGIWMTARMGREISSTRGGGWDDLLHTLLAALTFRSARTSKTEARA